MAASTGEAWSKILTISAKFKLSNVILDQLMDCYVSIVIKYLLTGTGILYEISTNSFSWGGLKKFSYTPPEKLLVSVFGGV